MRHSAPPSWTEAADLDPQGVAKKYNLPVVVTVAFRIVEVVGPEFDPTFLLRYPPGDGGEHLVE